MYYFIYPIKDTTLYSEYPELNTGLDQILELKKDQFGISRILIQFPVFKFNKVPNWESIKDSAKFYLKLYNAHKRNVAYHYEVYIHPLAQSWEMGIGQKSNAPITRDGATWNYRDNYRDRNPWVYTRIIQQEGFENVNLSISNGYFADGSQLFHDGYVYPVEDFFRNGVYEYHLTNVPLNTGYFESGSYLIVNNTQHYITGTFQNEIFIDNNNVYKLDEYNGYLSPGSYILGGNNIYPVEGYFYGGYFSIRRNIPVINGYLAPGSFIIENERIRNLSGIFNNGILDSLSQDSVTNHLIVSGGAYIDELNAIPLLPAVQHFEGETGDINLDVTHIVQRWLERNSYLSIENNGFLIKLSDEIERGNKIIGSVPYFSMDTNTIFVPKLIMKWDDSVYDITNTKTEEISQDFLLTITNIKPEYKVGDRVTFYLSVTPKWIETTFRNSVNYLNKKYRLPRNTFYSIIDGHNFEVLIPHDEYTRVSFKNETNYFNLWLDNFQPERNYKIVFYVYNENGTNIETVDNNYYFRVKK